MTREEAIIIIERVAHTEAKWPGTEDTLEALDLALTALCPVSREQVERMRGQWQWYKPCRESPEKWWGICSTCGHKQLLGEGEVNFCPSCGAPMTDKAVEDLKRKWEDIR